MKSSKLKFTIICSLILLISFNCLYFLPKVKRLAIKELRKIQIGKIERNNKVLSKKELYIKIKKIAAQELDEPYISDNATGSLFILQKEGFWWPAALITDSLEYVHQYSRLAQDLDSLIKFYNAKIDSSGNFINNLKLIYLDSLLHGKTLIYLERVTGDQRYKIALDRMYLFLGNHVKTGNGILPYRSKYPTIVLVDTVGMICPFLVRYGKVYNKPEAVEYGVKQLSDFIANSVDKKLNLPYHGYEATYGGYIGILGWGRGVGWYLYGLVGTLEHLPEGHISRNFLISELEKITETLKLYQKKDGSWSWAITLPSGRSDMSATVMIAFSLEKAISLNLIEKKYYSMLDKAFSLLASKTTQNGYVLDASGECYGPGMYSSTFDHQMWAQGPATGFLALLLNRAGQELK